MKLKTGLIIPDCHHPFEDKRAWQLLLKVGKALKPDTIVTMGDFLDLFSVSAHDKDPTRRLGLKEEVDYAKERISELDDLGASTKVFLAGNHEWRLERYLMQKAPELFTSLKIQELLGLAAGGWKYIPYKEHVQIGKLYLTHDCGKAGASAHNDARDAFEGSVVIGHTHRLAYAVKGNVKNKPHFGAMVGWLGDARAADYMFKVRAARDWTLGFGVAYWEPSGIVHFQPIPIVDYRVVVNGKLFEG